MTSFTAAPESNHVLLRQFFKISKVFEDNSFSLQSDFSTQYFLRSGAGLGLRTFGGSSLFVSCKGGKVCDCCTSFLSTLNEQVHLLKTHTCTFSILFQYYLTCHYLTNDKKINVIITKLVIFRIVNENFKLASCNRSTLLNVHKS